MLWIGATWVGGILLSWGCTADPPAPQDPPKVDPPKLSDPLTDQERRDDPTPEATRLIEARETPGSLDRAIRLLGWHVDRHPDSAPFHELLAEAHSRWVETLDLDKPDDRPLHELHRTQGLQHAEEAVKLAPQSGSAHYWLAALLLHAADAERSLGRARKALAELERAEQLSPSVDLGGPARLRGRVLAELPGIFGGSTRKAIESYRRSLELAPNCMTTHLWLAEAYQDDGKHDLERQELQWVVAARLRPGHEKADGDDQTKAREHLRKLEDR